MFEEEEHRTLSGSDVTEVDEGQCDSRRPGAELQPESPTCPTKEKVLMYIFCVCCS